MSAQEKPTYIKGDDTWGAFPEQYAEVIPSGIENEIIDGPFTNDTRSIREAHRRAVKKLTDLMWIERYGQGRRARYGSYFLRLLPRGYVIKRAILHELKHSLPIRWNKHKAHILAQSWSVRRLFVWFFWRVADVQHMYSKAFGKTYPFMSECKAFGNVSEAMQVALGVPDGEYAIDHFAKQPRKWRTLRKLERKGAVMQEKFDRAVADC